MESSTGVIGGIGNPFTLSAGTATLAGANTYTGLTTVTTGLLIAQGSNNSAGGVTVSSGGTLQLDNASNGGVASGTLTLSGRSNRFSRAGPVKFGLLHNRHGFRQPGHHAQWPRDGDDNDYLDQQRQRRQHVDPVRQCQP